MALSTQSALGFTPRNLTSFNTGEIFNLGKMIHSNNPISVTNNWFRGDMNLKFMNMDMSFRWRLHETPNNASPSTNPANNDLLDFLNQTTTETFTGVDGLTYTLVVHGFTDNGENSTCSATLPGGVSPVNQFSTVETKVTYGCLWASVEQVREITVKKVVDSPYGEAPDKNFGFTSTSTLAGAPWAEASPFTLTDGASITHSYNSGEEITITEDSLDGPWSLTDITCKDGNGASIGDVNGATVTIPKDTTADNATEAPITCTYTNTYEPTAKLTLKKDVESTGQPDPVAVPSNWTLTAQGQGPVSSESITGKGNSPAVTDQTVIAGTYELSELASGTNTGGYAQDGPWECDGGTLNGDEITLAHGDNVTCTVTNVYETGSLEITKTVTSEPDGGYTKGTTKPFDVEYVCTIDDDREVSGTATIHPDATNGTPGAAAVIPNLPADASCVITEVDPPAGTSADLENTSWVWGAPEPPSHTVTIPSNGKATVNFTNPVTQNTGSLKISKTVKARSGVPPSGYTGDSTRTFPIDYECKIGSTSTASGTVHVAAEQSETVTGIPATSDCTISETLSVQSGDFLDASFRWDGNDLTQPDTITKGGEASASVTNYFTRDLADLTITKTVVGDGYTSGNFSIAWACGNGDAEVSGTVTLAHGQSDTVQVPVGVPCTVVEDDSRPALSGGYVWGQESYEGLTDGKITVATDQTGEVTVKNPTEIGYNKISLTKEIANFESQVQPGTEFNVTVTCDAPARGEIEDYTGVFTFTTELSGSQSTPYLPVGTSCSVVETALPTGSSGLPGSSYAWVGTPTYTGLTDGAVTVPESTDRAQVKVINDIVRVYGPLAITKSVTTPDGISASGPFTGTWSCTFNGDTIGGAWSAPASGGEASLTGPTDEILVGSVCAITEDAPVNPVTGDNSYVWTVETPSMGDDPITTDGVTATVKNKLNRTTGSFSVSKSVDGGQAGTDFENTHFTFDYTCTPASGDPITGTLAVAAGGSASPAEEIPVGSTCVVTERTGSLPTPIDPFRWDGVDFEVTGAEGTQVTDGVAFVTPEDPEAAVAVKATNRMSSKTGSVAVTKEVTPLADGFMGGTDDLFPMTLTCEDPRTGDAAQMGSTQNIADDGTATWDGIAVGADCTVQEGTPLGGLKDASYAWNAPTYSPDSVVVPDDGSTPTITVTNSMHRVYGEISLEKIFDNGGHSGVVDSGRTYSGTWACAYGGDTVASGTWSGTGSSSGTEATLTATTGDLDSIPLTADCTATEDPLDPPSSTDGSYRWLTPQISGTTVGADADENVMTVTNKLARDTGSVLVEKTITGETAGFAPGSDFDGFTVGVVCALDPEDLGNADATRLQSEVAVQPGVDPVVLIDDVPLGWTCVANEPAPSSWWLYDGSYEWQSPVVTVDDETGEFEIGEDSSLVSVTNEITRVTGTIEIDKKIASGFEDYVKDDASFSGDYTCVYAEGVEDREENFAGTWAVTDSGAATLTGDTVLPLGTDCAITENAPDDENLIDASWTWDTPTIAPEADEVTANGPASFTVTNTPKRVYAAFEIEKVLEGPTGGFTDPDLTVDGSWECVYGDETVASGTWTAPGVGGPAVISPDDVDIPATADCTVRENTPDPDVFTDASYTWGSTPAAQTVTLSAGETAKVTMTNTVERLTGQFTITKLIYRGTGVTEQVPGSDVEYSGTYECTYDGESLGERLWSITGEGNTFTAPEAYYADTECTVTEEVNPSRAPVPADPSFVWGTPQIGDPVIVPVGESVNIDVTNRINRLTGSFGVTKKVSGDTEGLPEDPLYTFEWQCVAGNGQEFPTDSDEATFQLAAGKDWAPSEVIPRGSDCTVTETDLPEPLHESFTWDTQMTVTGAVAEVDGTTIEFTTPIDDDASVLVTATNTLTRGLGAFSVTKDVPEGSIVHEGMTFSGAYQCTGPLEGESFTGTWGPIEAGQTWTSEADIPLAADCSVTSEDRPVWPNDADHADQWDGPADFGEVVASSVEPEAITVTNRTTTVLGTVTWQKVDSITGDLLAGSTWLLTGPGVPEGTIVTDCTEGPCAEGAYLDQDSEPGEFLLTDLEWGEYTLTEETAPAGYYPDDTEHTFTIGSDEPGELANIDLEAIENTPITPPDLPFTGGLGRDAFLLTGIAVLALGAAVAFTGRMRSRQKGVA